MGLLPFCFTPLNSFLLILQFKTTDSILIKRSFELSQLIQIKTSLFFLLIIFLNSEPSLAVENGNVLLKIQNMPEASLLLASKNNENLVSIRADQAAIPASTLKLLTAYFALETWGRNHRFNTDFSLDKNNRLWIKGYGDPFLISEELDRIVIALKEKGLESISGIGIDDSAFSANILINGQSETDNPYDAPLSSLGVNFNTMSILIKKNSVQSAESQTPLTPLMILKSRDLTIGSHRINLGNQTLAAEYFAEVFSEKLQQANIKIHSQTLFAKVPDHAHTFYRHFNSHNLANVISAMLKYSNNFIANQLYLLLGAETAGFPANMQKSQTVISNKIQNEFYWKNVKVVEGAGLSRENKLSAEQLVKLLQRFAPYRDLLSPQNDHIFAKSGTLTDVSSYAGYIYKENEWMPFALLINRSIDHNFRKKVAAWLANN